MPGNKLTRRQADLIAELGEEEVFTLYLEVGGVNKLLQALGDMFENLGKPGRPTEDGGFRPLAANSLYKFIKAEEGRQERWDELQEWQETGWKEEMIEIADGATEESVRVDTLRVRARQHVVALSQGGRARKKEAEGLQSLGLAWLATIKGLEAKRAEESNQTGEIIVEAGESVGPENRLKPENPTKSDSDGDA